MASNSTSTRTRPAGMLMVFNATSVVVRGLGILFALNGANEGKDGVRWEARKSWQLNLVRCSGQEGLKSVCLRKLMHFS